MNSPPPDRIPTPSRGKVISTRVFESGPPVPAVQQELVETTTTEEVTTKKKKDVHVTKQIETRVKREILVNEDGEIIEDSGPTITTETSEETKEEEQETTEHKRSGEQDLGPEWTLLPESTRVTESKHVHTDHNNTKEEKNDVEETEEVGGLTREQIFRALKQRELRALGNGRGSTPTNVKTVEYDTKRTTIDTEEVDEVSEFKDGEVSTETNRKVHHEELIDDSVPRNQQYIASTEVSPPRVSLHPYNSSATSTLTKEWPNGQQGASKPRQQSPPIDEEKWESISERLLRHKRELLAKQRAAGGTNVDPGLLTKTTVDIELEEETRRSETQKWLESHFGSQDFEEAGLLIDSNVSANIKSPHSPAADTSGYGSSTQKPGGNSFTVVRTPSKSSSGFAQSSSPVPHGSHSPTNPILNTSTESADTVSRKTHYTKRQQLPGSTYYKPQPTPPPPPPPMPTGLYSSAGHRTNHVPVTKNNSHTSLNSSGSQGSNKSNGSRSSTPRRQYYLGEDPGVGQRFLGVIPDIVNSSTTSMYKSKSMKDITSTRQETSKPNYNSDSIRFNATSTPVKFATLARSDTNKAKSQDKLSSKVPISRFESDPYKSYQYDMGDNQSYQRRETHSRYTDNHIFEKSDSDNLTTHYTTLRRPHKNAANVNYPKPESVPTASDIIRSLRSKDFIDRENSVITLRDDDSLSSFRPSTKLNRPPRRYETTVTAPLRTVQHTNHINKSTYESSRTSKMNGSSPAYDIRRETAASKKPHVIKIAIKGDEPDYSPINSPRNVSNGYHGSKSFDFNSGSYSNSPAGSSPVPSGNFSNYSTLDADRPSGGGIVRKAINNLLKQTLNRSPSFNNNNEYNESNQSTLTRNGRRNTPNGSSLGGTRTYLTTSTPNVNKAENNRNVPSPKPQNSYNNSPYSTFTRSVSIGNLNSGSNRSTPTTPMYTSMNGFSGYNSPYMNGHTNGTYDTYNRSTNRTSESKRQFMQGLLSKSSNDLSNGSRSTTPRGIVRNIEIKREEDEEPYIRPVTTRSAKPTYITEYQPPPSPSGYYRNSRLPSPVPPPSSRFSSPPPPLTRPMSPTSTDYYSAHSSLNRNTYDRKFNVTSPRYNYSQSPSPPPYSPSPTFTAKPPPSPVPPPAKYQNGDHLRVMSPTGRSGITSASSRTQPERVEVKSKKKTTTTTVKKREIEIPEKDYY